MRGESLLKKLHGSLGNIRGRIGADVAMSRFTRFQVGGRADIMFQPEDREDLALFLQNLPEEIPVTVIGHGSNLLVRDRGIAGVVIRLLCRDFGSVRIIEDSQIYAGAAIPDKKLAAIAMENEIGGLEFYHGIPGNIGGALRMNAGANGRETADHLVEAIAIDRKGNIRHFTCADMGYSYRYSAMSPDMIFVGAVFKGSYRKKSEIQELLYSAQQHRYSVQPIRDKTGGSTFKNPPGHSAWKLIDDAGMRGFMLGGAQISPLHCNFMINTGEASAFDLENLAEKVRARVWENSGIKLQWEIKVLGRK